MEQGPKSGFSMLQAGALSIGGPSLLSLVLVEVSRDACVSRATGVQAGGCTCPDCSALPWAGDSCCRTWILEEPEKAGTKFPAADAAPASQQERRAVVVEGAKGLASTDAPRKSLAAKEMGRGKGFPSG